VRLEGSTFPLVARIPGRGGGRFSSAEAALVAACRAGACLSAFGRPGAGPRRRHDRSHGRLLEVRKPTEVEAQGEEAAVATLDGGFERERADALFALREDALRETREVLG
jgi:hypothetical protein